MSAKNIKHIIGIDFDGLHVRLGKVKSSRMQLCSDFKIDADADQNTIIQELIDSIDNLFDDEVAGIGIGVPSIVDVQNGIVYDVARIPSWKEVHLKKLLSEYFKVPVYVNNDANCFAIGEKYFGIGQKYQNLVGLIIGEGMGAGVVCGGKLLSGPNCGIGEFGRISYNYADLEYHCSAKYFEYVAQVPFEEVLYLAEKGDKEAQEIFSQYGEYLGDALQMIVYALDPEIIILGGKISLGYPYFQEGVRRKVRKISFRHASKKLKIELSENPHIGVLGAAALYHDAMDDVNLTKLESDKQAAEIELRESKEKYYQLFNQIADPIFIFDKKTYKFLDCNEEVIKRIYGYSNEELQSMTPLDLHPPEELDKVSKRLRIKNKDIPFRYKHVTKTGKKIDVEILSDEINYDGHIASLSIVRDVTERVRTEQELKRKAIQTTLLYRVGNQISSQLELDRLLEEIVHTIRNSFDYFGVMLLLLDEKGKRLHLKSIAGGYEDVFPSDLSLEIGQGMVGMAAQKKEIQVSGDVQNNPYYIRKGDESTKSELSAPILSGKRVIGVLDIQTDQLYAFDKDDTEVVATLCTQIASAIDNAGLYQQAQQEINERIHAQREVVKSRNSLQKVKKETDNILENVEEGLFTLDKNYRIASQYSTALCKMFNRDDLARKSIMDVLHGKIENGILNNTAEYFELMFNQELDEQDINELNPLTQVEFSLSKSDIKFLSFNFRRINHKKQIIGLIATVNDITEPVLLAQKLEKSKAQSKRQMDWFLNILHVEPDLIQEFIDSVETEIPGIEKLLDSLEKKHFSEELIDTIYRSVHLVKGNASLLDLTSFSELAHACEERLQKIKKQAIISETGINDLRQFIREISDSIEEIKRLIEKIGQIQNHFKPKGTFESNILLRSIDNFIQNLGHDFGKEVRLDTRKFNVKALPSDYRLLVKDILIQLVRNSLFHGIESKAERRKLKKNETAKIEISACRKNQHFEFTYIDDGRGLPINQIRAIAKKSGKYDNNELVKWRDKQVAQLIFEPGISTAKKSEMHAGRGVGMDLVRSKISKHRGKIAVDSKQDRYCKFVISLPINSNGKNNN
jgi:glucokinase